MSERAALPALAPATASISVRRPRRAVVVLAGGGGMSDGPARGLLASLGELGVETVYLGREANARRIAAVVVEERADVVELCLAGAGGVLLLRELLRELNQIGRRDVSIVVQRVEAGDERRRGPPCRPRNKE
jgi:methylmalonyl-CoA mutase cobalamin-binding domain/chain